MKILMICGYFAKENEAEVIRHARGNVEFSANEFQKKLIHGMQALGQELYVVSAPFIGSYPNTSDIRVFQGFEQVQKVCRYVSFNNLWGIRNISRARQLKKAIRFFIDLDDKEKLILVYCAHTPFLKAAAYAKRMDSRIRICFYVPDLPNYMNLNVNRSKLYDIAKAYDNMVMHRYMKSVDNFVLLTEYMKECLPVGNKSCMVVEGIIERAQLGSQQKQISEEIFRYVVYTGKMNTKFGVRTLIDGFSGLSDPNCRLVLCGEGDCMDYVHSVAQKDNRIIVAGQVTPEEAARWQCRAAVLVNPRPNNELYTRYSFPSKNVEYLLSGKPVVAYMLSGMPEIYRNFIYEIKDDSPESITQALTAAMNDTVEVYRAKHQAFLDYARGHLDAEVIGQEILNLSKRQIRR